MTDDWAVITPYVTQADVDQVKRLHRVVVNDAFRLAPDADILVAQDLRWWQCNPDAIDFDGDKYSSASVPGVSPLRPDGVICSGTDSGSVGIYKAVERGAKRILLLGFHMHDRHKFAKHQYPLRNPTQERLGVWRAHYAAMTKRLKVEIINCTPGSDLRCFPIMNLADAVSVAA